MTNKWPTFETADLGDTEQDAAEMMRRWEEYDRQAKAITSAGGVHQDEDGWWVDDATGELLGPDPDIERPFTDEEWAKARPFRDVLPEIYESIRRSRGRPKVEMPKEAVTLRIDPDTLARFKATGTNWRARMAEALKAVDVK